MLLCLTSLKLKVLVFLMLTIIVLLHILKYYNECDTFLVSECESHMQETIAILLKHYGVCDNLLVRCSYVVHYNYSCILTPN